MYLEVAFPLPLPRTFHYLSPDAGDRVAVIGRRVAAPFGPKTLVGYVVGTTTAKPPFEIKPVRGWIDGEPMLNSKLLELARSIAEAYLCSLGEALAAILPSQMAAPKRPRVEEQRPAMALEAKPIT